MVSYQSEDNDDKKNKSCDIKAYKAIPTPENKSYTLAANDQLSEAAAQIL